MSRGRGTAAAAKMEPGVQVPVEAAEEPRSIASEPPVPENGIRVRIAERGWVDFERGLDGEDWLLMWELENLDGADRAEILRMYGPIMALIKKHTLGHSLDRKPILRRSSRELLAIWRAWNDALEADALDPTPASG